MSKWRVEIDMAFDSESDAIALINTIEQAKSKLYKGSDTDGISVVKSVRYHECFHDENPAKPCTDYKFVDIDDPVIKEHKTKDDEVYILKDPTKVKKDEV